ncbi:Lactonase, 7-bladed beta propeller [Niveomyces insectorum RCEF 264]|uniref:Lactonase, 7-bladed beta propeller n=1 Tax=Niveomyces insectorum RCEF 264 TaxID=1081102 RepID=A0A162KBK2_9HYPO|nr:Lactonase, 7-bladed beta propeller [Niveomyces insectorum RCEF 264]
MVSFKSSLSALLCLLPAAALADTANLLVSHYNGNIYTLTLTTGSTSSLTVSSSVKACGQMPSWLTLDKEGGKLYCTDESGANVGSTITSLTVGDAGVVKVLATERSPGGELHSTLFGGSDGKGFIAAAEYDPSAIATFKLPLSSGASYQQRFHYTMTGPGPNRARQDKPHPHSTFTDPTGKFLLSADLGADLIRIFSISAADGKLTECPAAATAPADGPRHGSWWQPKANSTDGTMLYIANELGNSVTVWQATYPTGTDSCLTLKKTQSLSAYPAGKSAPANSKTAEVHTFGNFVYASNRNDRSFGPQQDSCATYTVDPATGALTFLESTSAHSYYTRTFQINKAGDLVAFGGQTSSNVAIVARNVTTGRLGDLVANVQVGTPGVPGNEDGLSAVIWDE